jgi:hypothetical protein
LPVAGERREQDDGIGAEPGASSTSAIWIT